MADEKPELAAINFTTPPVSHDVEENIDQDIPRNDKTPSILEQAKSSGWECEYYNFGKAEENNTDFFNPGIIERPDGLWLLTRASGLHPQGFMYGQNAIIAFKLDDTGKIPKYGKILKWPVDNPQQHFEDPRGFYHSTLNQTFIGCCTFTWNGPGDWSGPHQAFGAWDEDWESKKMDYPRIGGNPGSMEKITEHAKYEKNWLWWLAQDRLTLLYKANPWMVFQFKDRWSDREEYSGAGLTWASGEIRGGTTPIQVGDLYFTFHHSSLPWKGRYRRYYAGCLAFDAKPPFTPRLLTYEPLLTGSQNDTWSQRKPLVVFPCGAIYRDQKWLVTLGVNDLKSAWIEIPHKDLLKRMQPVGNDDSFIFRGLPPNLSGGIEETQRQCVGVKTLAESQTDSQFEPEGASSIRDVSPAQKPSRKPLSTERLQAMRENLARARAIRAAKRNGGDAKCNTTSTVNVGTADKPQDVCSNAVATFKPKSRRRRKRFKCVTAEARQQALRDFEASKT